MILVVFVASCGGDDDAEPSGGSDTTTVADDGGAGANGDSNGGGDDDGGSGVGASFGDFTVDGVTLRFAMSDITYSNVEGLEDITFESCAPDFFGAGLFANGLPVDDSGELVFDGVQVAGAVSASLPHEGTDPELMDIEFSFDYSPLGINARYRAIDGSEASYTTDGNGAKGTVTLVNVLGEPTVVDFEIVCGS